MRLTIRNVTAVDPGTPRTTSRCAPVAPATGRDVITLLPAKLNSRKTWSAAFACVHVTTRIVLTLVETATVTPETYASPAPAPALPVVPPAPVLPPAPPRPAAPAAPLVPPRPATPVTPPMPAIAPPRPAAAPPPIAPPVPVAALPPVPAAAPPVPAGAPPLAVEPAVPVP